MPKAAARTATAWAMLPMPTRPRVLPWSSVRLSSFLAHSPAAIVVCAFTRWLGTASIMAKASSATAIAGALGVLWTTMPFSAQ